jgi:hypothetical protein
MNILFLIGNGFDLNLGMKTRYSDFYKYYITKKSSSKLVQELKESINSNIENWSDLELALGEYTKNLKSTEEFNEVFDDIEDNLGDYLEWVEEKFDYSQLDKTKLLKFLAHPENSLPSADRNMIKSFKQKWRSTQNNINVITFNYTQSIEKLTDYDGNPIRINSLINIAMPSIIIQKIEHIHGYTDERMVMGVNDVSQISNNKFHTNEDVIETLVKVECNKAQKHNIDDWCKKQISEANLICVFGSSIGDTDNIWWQLIGDQLKKECKLIIYEKGEQIPRRRPQKGKILERSKKTYFLNKTKLNESEKESAKDKIYFGINTNMFDIKTN